MHSLNLLKRATPFGNLAEWWRGLRTRRAGLDELYRFGSDLERLARDVNLSAPDLHAIVAKWPSGAGLLQRRLATLELDPSVFSPVRSDAARDLERVCALCGSKARCEHDLTGRASNPAWRDYCLNVSTLDALQSESTSRKPVDG
jgi:hypothetical protein